MGKVTAGLFSSISQVRVALTVEDDFNRAVSFYRDALGLAQLDDWSSEYGRVVLLDVGHATLELLDEQQAAHVDQIEVGRRISGRVRLGAGVQDGDLIADKCVAAGAAVLSRGVPTPWGDRNFRLQTPDGLQLTLFSEA
jgi:lactoylglutathione lyase